MKLIKIGVTRKTTPEFAVYLTEETFDGTVKFLSSVRFFKNSKFIRTEKGLHVKIYGANEIDIPWNTWITMHPIKFLTHFTTEDLLDKYITDDITLNEKGNFVLATPRAVEVEDI